MKTLRSTAIAAALALIGALPALAAGTATLKVGAALVPHSEILNL